MSVQDEMIKPTDCPEHDQGNCPECGSERLKESGGAFYIIVEKKAGICVFY
jgi:RNA polymerase subunit RPABC4/transcription elongation factor Spt4